MIHLIFALILLFPFSAGSAILIEPEVTEGDLEKCEITVPAQTITIPAFSPTGKGIHHVIIQASAKCCDKNGNCSIVATVTPSPMCGDLNGDQKVDVTDLTIFRRYFGGLSIPEFAQKCLNSTP